MGVADPKRFLSWLSQLDEAEPVIQRGDNLPSERFTFGGIPVEKQTFDASFTFQRPPPRASGWQQTHVELENSQQPCLPTRPTRKGTDCGITRKEKNGYERIPRAKTREDRYEYKGTSSRVKDDQKITARKKKYSRQKRKHTINEEFHVSNVPSNRLTLRPAQNLGIFSRGKRSSSVKLRVLDHSFSETELLKAPAPRQANQSFRHADNITMFDYDIEMGNTSQAHNETGVKLLGPSIEKTPQQQSLSGNTELDQSYTAIYHGPEDDPNPKADAVRVSFSQLFDHGKEREGSHTGLIDYSLAERDMCSAADLAGESGTTELLDFHLHLPDKSVTTNSAKKYWTLEDLKNLMQQRMSSWKPKDEDSIMTLTSQLQQDSRERKHTSPQEDGNINSEFPKKRRILGHRQRVETKLTDRSTSPQTINLDSCSFSSGCIDFALGKPLPMHGQTNHAIEGNRFQPQRPCRDRGASPFYDEDISLISLAFDVAYEAVMRSERDAPLDLPDSVPTRRGNPGNNVGSIVMQAPWKWGLEDEETLNSSHVGKEMFLSHREPAFDMTVGRYSDRQCPHYGERHVNRECHLTTEEDLAMGQVLGQNDSKANKLNLNVGAMKNFWRQNKLY